MTQLIPDPEFNDPLQWVIPNPEMAVIEDGHLELINLSAFANRPRTPPLAFVEGKKYSIRIDISAWPAGFDLHVFIFPLNPIGQADHTADYMLNGVGVNGAPGVYVIEHIAGPTDAEIHLGDRPGGFGGVANATIESLYVSTSEDAYGIAESIAESISESISE